jgi:hypothetical protein
MNIYQFAFFSLTSDAKAFPELGEIKKKMTYHQCCGSGSGSGSGSRREKMTHKNRKKLINLIF